MKFYVFIAVHVDFASREGPRKNSHSKYMNSQGPDHTAHPRSQDCGGTHVDSGVSRLKWTGYIYLSISTRETTFVTF